jgi:hypothetical protein
MRESSLIKEDSGQETKSPGSHVTVLLVPLKARKVCTLRGLLSTVVRQLQARWFRGFSLGENGDRGPLGAPDIHLILRQIAVENSPETPYGTPSYPPDGVVLRSQEAPPAICPPLFLRVAGRPPGACCCACSMHFDRSSESEEIGNGK